MSRSSSSLSPNTNCSDDVSKVSTKPRGASPPKPSSWSTACHWSRSTTPPELAVVQDDVEVDRPWLEPLLEALERDPSVGAAGSRVSLLDGTPRSDGIVI